ncbi:hypothetical protein [Luteibacter sp.]|uniref:hypothetical protein n=1 Tax=Luteibacter sp. TaxID=1886636 RepID=UPI0025C70FC0|nr:hypothetical protein [Luteibacter sp.]
MKIKSIHWLTAGSILSALGSLYFFLSIFAAASLASGYCKGKFSLFAEAMRCRQVHFAMILTILFAALCAYLGWKAARASQRNSDATDRNAGLK